MSAPAGLILSPAAVLIEGAPLTVDGRGLVGFGYVTVVATALAFVAWFTGLRHLGAGTVGLVGLLNPITGVLLGTALADEGRAPQQVCGLALVLSGIVLGQPVTARVMARRPPLTGMSLKVTLTSTNWLASSTPGSTGSLMDSRGRSGEWP